MATINELKFLGPKACFRFRMKHQIRLSSIKERESQGIVSLYFEKNG